jgi:hypothetical protein
MNLPGILAEIAQLVGEPAAVNIAARVGGSRVYIPATVADDHWLVECVGRAKAEQICRHFAVDGGGQEIDVPIAGGGAYAQLRRAVARRIHELDLAKKSEREIAKDVRVTGRTVRRHRRAHRGGGKGDKQGRLF